MNKHQECQRGFSILSEAWHARTSLSDRTVDEIMIGMYHPEGGTTGEFCVTWDKLGGRVVPKLEAFNDSWSALAKFADVLSWMASFDDREITPKQFADALRTMGVKDLTERDVPTKPIPTLTDIQDALPL